MTRPHRGVRRQWLAVGAGLVVGTLLLGLSLAAHQDGPRFYLLTLALAATWIIAAFLAGPVPLRPAAAPIRSITTGVIVGLLAAGVYVLGALVVREIGPLRDYVSRVLTHAQHGSITLILLVTLGNAVAEETFFRGALYDALGGWRPVASSTLIYAAATAATGNPSLVFAAVTLGFVLAVQRRLSGSVLGPIVTHVVWSGVLLFALPPLFGVPIVLR